MSKSAPPARLETAGMDLFARWEAGVEIGARALRGLFCGHPLGVKRRDQTFRGKGPVGGGGVGRWEDVCFNVLFTHGL